MRAAPGRTPGPKAAACLHRTCRVAQALTLPDSKAGIDSTRLSAGWQTSECPLRGTRPAIDTPRMKRTKIVALDHLSLPVRGLKAARKFYDAALGAIGMRINLDVG